MFGCVGLVIFFWPQANPVYPTAGTTVVLFGDSLAAGVGSTAGNSIAQRLEKDLGQPVINLGVSGDTTSDGLARIDLILKADPKVVIILLGGNDAIQQVPVTETFINLSEIIQQIMKSGAAVVLVAEPGGLFGSQYEKEYERLASEHRTFFVTNILSGLLAHPQYMSDYIHPNDAGYEIAASRILPVVVEALSGK
ncbi:MAG: hypothetical protein RLZZ230_272 [Candidatus Parcubacteria bacterium]